MRVYALFLLLKAHNPVL